MNEPFDALDRWMGLFVRLDWPPAIGIPFMVLTLPLMAVGGILIAMFWDAPRFVWSEWKDA